MKGRKPLPTEFKVISGEKRKHRLNPGEPRPDISIPEPPAFLSAEALKEWNRITPELERLGIITVLDRLPLAVFCQVSADLAEAERQLHREGFTVATANGGTKTHPLVGIVNMFQTMLHKYAVEFGMTPSSRSRVKALKPETNERRNTWATL